MKKMILILAAGAMALGLGAQEKKMYQRFADDEIKRFPECWQFDHGSRPFFGYTQGVGAMAMLGVWQATGDEKYYDYVYRYADFMVNDEGKIFNYNYDIDPYNLDLINAGKMFFTLYERTGDEKYKKAMDMLYNTLQTHPRNSLGGFWHKQIYPWQMWLDGLYMATTYLLQYGVVFDKPEAVDDAIDQFLLVKQYMHNPENGLYYHAWDEAKRQRWADPETGLSHIFWGRSIGWWWMAVVDILDYVPEDHPKRPELIEIVQGLADAVPKYQDGGLWYQVVDMGGREGNYQEASVSSMFMYCIAKAVNKGYISQDYMKYAEAAYEGLTTTLMRVDEDGTLNLTNCCAVAGLGGSPYRDGSYEYYINERIRDNDGKATGPFIMGCLQLNK